MDRVTEGTLYKSITVEGKTFDIHYGYYSESERGLWGPTPIFPDFTKKPMYSSRGQPFVRADQDICEHYQPKQRVSGENWCNDCVHFTLGQELIGVCQCESKNTNLRKNE